MRTLLYIGALLVIHSCGESAPADPDEAFVPKPGTDTTAMPAPASAIASPELNNVEDIKNEYQQLTSKLEHNSLDSASFTYNCNGEKNGKVVYYSDDEGLRLITHTYHEYSHFSGTDAYYVKDDSLFFVYNHHLAWSFDTKAQGSNETIDKVTEQRYYIIDNKALQCLEKKYSIKSSSTDKTAPQMAANKETDCASLEAVLNNFKLLKNYRSQKKSQNCLEE